MFPFFVSVVPHLIVQLSMNLTLNCGHFGIFSVILLNLAWNGLKLAIKRERKML